VVALHQQSTWQQRRCVTINLAAMAFVACKLRSGTRGENINNNQPGRCVVALLHTMQQHASCANDDRNA